MSPMHVNANLIQNNKLTYIKDKDYNTIYITF
jgi:hypothetical protein